MIKFKDLKKGDILVSNFDLFEGEVTGLVNFYASTYVTNSEGRTRRILPEELGGYMKKETQNG
jgi:hypothetical protein